MGGQRCPGIISSLASPKFGTDLGRVQGPTMRKAGMKVTHQRMFPMWLMASFLFPEKMPDTVPGAGSRLSGLVGLMSA